MVSVLEIKLNEIKKEMKVECFGVALLNDEKIRAWSKLEYYFGSIKNGCVMCMQLTGTSVTNIVGMAMAQNISITFK